MAWKKLPTHFEENQAHFHKVGVEVNVVVSGGYVVEINGETVELKQRDFLVVYPEAALRNISAQPNTELLVIKAPSVANDKFDVE